MNRFAVAIISLFLLAVAHPAVASGPFVDELRSLKVVTTDGVGVEVSIAEDRMLLAVERQGTIAEFDIELVRAGTMVLEDSSIATDHWLEAGSAKERLMITIAVATDEFDANDEGIVDVYEISVEGDPMSCKVLLADGGGSVTGQAACTPGAAR